MKVRLIYFSPTGTTRRVLEAIASGMDPDVVTTTNLTVRAFLSTHVDIALDEFTLIGAPVYVSRIPEEMRDRFKKISGNGSTAAIVAVYGNNKYGDALVELLDLAKDAEFNPVAGATFIGEHSFSSENRGIADGRPDPDDVAIAKRFGRELREKLDAGEFAKGSVDLAVPGHRPYVDRKSIPATPPTTNTSICLKCGNCGEVCPVDAISIGVDGAATDPTLCVYCCACVKECSIGARVLSDPKLNQIADRLHRDCAERKEPELFV